MADNPGLDGVAAVDALLALVRDALEEQFALQLQVGGRGGGVALVGALSDSGPAVTPVRLWCCQSCCTSCQPHCRAAGCCAEQIT